MEPHIFPRSNKGSERERNGRQGDWWRPPDVSEMPTRRRFFLSFFRISNLSHFRSSARAPARLPPFLFLSLSPCDVRLHHRENQSAEAAAINTVCKPRRRLWNYFISELRQSASQNLSEKNVAVLTAPSFLERFCEADWRNSETK